MAFFRRLAVLVAALVFTGAGLRAQEGPLVACASDLQFAMAEVASAFERETGLPVRLTFGASGNLARQIEQGAPFQLFLSADEGFVFGLAEKGIARDAGVLYATGHLVLFAPAGSPLADNLSVEALRAGLADGSVKRLAIANPEHAPYGRAARDWLQTHGLWEAAQPALVLGENVSQAAQFATSGSQAGIIPLSLALAPQIGGRGRFVPLDEADHKPLRQRMALLRNATADAGRFYEYIQGPAARAIMRRFGFVLPGEGLPATP